MSPAAIIPALAIVYLIADQIAFNRRMIEFRRRYKELTGKDYDFYGALWILSNGRLPPP